MTLNTMVKGISLSNLLTYMAFSLPEPRCIRSILLPSSRGQGDRSVSQNWLKTIAAGFKILSIYSTIWMNKLPLNMQLTSNICIFVFGKKKIKIHSLHKALTLCPKVIWGVIRCTCDFSENMIFKMLPRDVSSPHKICFLILKFQECLCRIVAL